MAASCEEANFIEIEKFMNFPHVNWTELGNATLWEVKIFVEGIKSHHRWCSVTLTYRHPALPTISKCYPFKAKSVMLGDGKLDLLCIIDFSKFFLANFLLSLQGHLNYKFLNLFIFHMI